VFYPRLVDTKPFYDNCRRPNGGYGGLLSATFHETKHAITFFDAIDTSKGPSLGTNFTLRLVIFATSCEWPLSALKLHIPSRPLCGIPPRPTVADCKINQLAVRYSCPFHRATMGTFILYFQSLASLLKLCMTCDKLAPQSGGLARRNEVPDL
jgi:hypothetical protein